MIKKLNYLIILFLTCTMSEAQNLVPNGDFEQFITCPTATGQLNFATSWSSPLLGGSPDYLNQCAVPGTVNVPYCTYGYQPSHSGAGMGGISLWSSYTANFRENMEIQLTSPLIANECYHFEMFVNRGNNSTDSTNDIGVYFSVPFISGMNNLFSFTPQITNPQGNSFDTLNWTLVSGNYTAAGGEQFLIIGNLKDDASTVAGVADSSAMYPVAYAFIDDVSLSVCTGFNSTTASEEIIIYPNPFTENIYVETMQNKPLEIILYDITSRKLLEQRFIKAVSLNAAQLKKGIYIYEVRPVPISSRNKNSVITKGKIIKN